MTNPQISLFVTDLDNTLYDWVTFFATAFYEMTGVAARLLDVAQDTLLDELREVHRRHHNSEHPFALLETATVRDRYSGLSRSALASKLDEAFHAFNRARNETLKLYPGVRETLEALRNSDVPVVGHTEATVPNALYRLKKLGIDGYFSRLYAVEPSGDGHHDPEREKELLKTHIVMRYLRQDERKPDPQVLLDICRDMDSPLREVVYVGDSIPRDVGMAKAAGTWSAWAQYGTRYDMSLWERLVRITHWSDEDVRRAEAAKRLYGATRPDVVLGEKLSEILDQFMLSPSAQTRS